MKSFSFFLFCMAVIYSCKEQTKTTTEKFTDTAYKDSVRFVDAQKRSVDSLKTDSLTKAAIAASNDTITAGERVGRVFLNEATDAVINDLGQPDSADAAMGKTMLSWYTKPSGKGTDTAMNSTMIFAAMNAGAKDEVYKVKQIRITSPFFKTAQKIGCGSTVTFIKLQYPQLKKPNAVYRDKKTGTEIMLYDETDEGIAFEINEATKCVGITVHEPGKKAREIYSVIYGREKE